MIRFAAVALAAGFCGALVLNLGALALAAIIDQHGIAFAAMWALLTAVCFLGLYALRVLASPR